MRYNSDDANRTGDRNVKLNKNASVNTVSNEMFYPDERALCFTFKQISFCLPS